VPADPVQVQFGIIREERWDLFSREYADANSAFGASESTRRAVRKIDWEDQTLEVKQSFQAAQTAELEKWVNLGPIVCCMIGVAVAVLHAAWDTYELRRDRKVHAMFEHFAVNEKDDAGGVDVGGDQDLVATAHPLTSEQNGAANQLILQDVEDMPSNLDHAKTNGPDGSSRQQDENMPTPASGGRNRGDWVGDAGAGEGKEGHQEQETEQEGPAANGLPHSTWPHMHVDETSVGAKVGGQAQQAPQANDARDQSAHPAPIPAPAMDVPIPKPLVPKAPPAPA